jgi:hypothetical protein
MPFFHIMKRIWILPLMCSVVGSVLGFAQSVEHLKGIRPSGEGTPGSIRPPGVWEFYVRGVRYSTTINLRSVLTAPSWSPSQPLPLNFASVEEIARRELHRFVENDAAWEPTDFSLHRVQGAIPPRWFYVIEFKPTSMSYTNGHADNVRVAVDSAGKPGMFMGPLPPER